MLGVKCCVLSIESLLPAIKKNLLITGNANKNHNTQNTTLNTQHIYFTSPFPVYWVAGCPFAFFAEFLFPFVAGLSAIVLPVVCSAYSAAVAASVPAVSFDRLFYLFYPCSHCFFVPAAFLIPLMPFAGFRVLLYL